MTNCVVHELEDQRFIARDSAGATKVADLGAPLDAWGEACDFSKHHIVRGHIAARSGEEVLRQLADGFKRSKAEYAATGLAGALLLDQFAGFRLAAFCVPRLPSEKERKAMGFHEESRRKNEWLVAPNDQGVSHGAAERDGIHCVPPVQVYLDLGLAFALVGEACCQEVAERLRLAKFEPDKNEEGKAIAGETAKQQIRVCGPGAFVVLKAVALHISGGEQGRPRFVLPVAQLWEQHGRRSGGVAPITP